MVVLNSRYTVYNICLITEVYGQLYSYQTNDLFSSDLFSSFHVTSLEFSFNVVILGGFSLKLLTVRQSRNYPYISSSPSY